MINKLPSKHLGLLCVICLALALVISITPSKSNQTTAKINLQANLQVVDLANLTLSPTLSLPEISLPPLQSKQENTLTNKAEIVALDLDFSDQASPSDTTDIAVPAALQQRQQAPTFSHQVETIKNGDSLSKILSNHGISQQDIYKVSQADAKEGELLRMRPGQTLEFKIQDTDKQLVALTLVKNKLEKVTFARVDNAFTSDKILREPDIVQTYKEATINNSLFVDGLREGISESILFEMANIFGWDIDFALDIREGDTFSLLYEEKYLDGEQIGLGNILAAQFINNGRTYQAIRYETKQGASYYTPDGLAMRKAFLRTPVDFTRISSKFNPNRLHPVFKTTRPHRGVDYAASSGTPVKAAGDGKISFAGKQNGYGNVVIIDHGEGYTTLYAH